MRKPLVVPALLLLALPLTGCNKVQARIELKEGNSYYQQEQYQAALNQYKKGLELDPDATFAWRSAGMSALALYRPGDAAPENQALGQEATGAFEKYLADYPEDTKVQDFLLGLYMETKQYDKALAYADNQLQNDPNNAAGFNLKIRILLAQDRLQEAWQMAQNHRGENRVAAFVQVGNTAWGKAYNDATLTLEKRTEYVDTGLEALRAAIQTEPENIDALTYYNLLLREKAKLTTDATERATLIAEAEENRIKASNLRKAQAEKEAAAAAAATPEAPAEEPEG
jgi:tetratricopeptide (TPR) repeat protein